ncbi:DegT/DnrJ/EryC1/StrS aminotransferase family protein [Dehalococcoidia bacterium]|nr:DegT/DnrJ/EryC1/StrS aminotransferase family protein [Dehalococcoidia bacterium]
MGQFIPLARPFMDEEEEQEVIDTLRSGLIATGPKTERFEREFAAYLGRKHAIGTNSCTAALHLGLLALGVGPGDEVVTTPMTFVATANSIIYAGARPVFVDVEPDTINIDPARIEEAITERTGAIMIVHLYGHPCEMDEISDIARRHGLKVIGDCAHAIEAEYRGKKTGALGYIDCFSFYATKNLATGNGGMLVTDDDNVAGVVQSLRDHGMSSGAWARYHTGEFQHYQMTALGYKSIMWDVPAALGLHQLRRLEQRHRKRVELAALYDALLEPLNAHVQPLRPRKHVRHAWHIYAVLLKDVNRDRVASGMQARGIGVGVHYRPIHLEPFYRKRYGYSPGEFPVAEDAAARLLSLPFWPEMKEEEALRVVAALGEIVRGGHTWRNR